MPILTQKALVLAKIETTQGVDSSPSATTDAFLCENPVFTVNSTNLERNFARPDFSQYPSRIGRKLAQVTFGIQLAGSGSAGTEPTWAILFRACGMARSSVSASTAPTNGTLSQTAAGALAGATYYVKCTWMSPAGESLPSTETNFVVSANNVLNVASPASPPVGATAWNVYVSTTTGAETKQNLTPIPIGTPWVEPTTGLVAGAAPPAANTLGAHIHYAPVTTSQETVTIYVYYEGLLHKMTGCMGTYTIQADAGGYAMMNFTMTGCYNTPTNAGYPGTVTLQDVVPPQCELAQLSYNYDNTLVVNSFKVDMGNNVVARPDINSSNGYKATRISGRNSTGGFDPEVEVTHTFWSQLEASTMSAFTAGIGTVVGNQMVFYAPKAQILGIQYQDRDNLRAWDLSLAYRRNTGNDEVTIDFY